MSSSTTTRRSDRTSVRVVEAIADATDSDVFDLQPPLYDAIDPSALDQLVDDGDAVSVRFEYQDHLVTVDGDGTVSIDERIAE